MKILRTKACIIGIALAVIFPATAQSYSAGTKKIDPALATMLQSGADLAAAKAKGIVKSLPDSREPLVKTILKFSGDVSGIEALGGKIGSITGDVATVDIPLHAIDQIAQLSNVVYIEAARRLRPRLDVSVPATGANTLRSGTPPNWTGNTGRNVIVGIVDTGIDLHHRDFKDQSGNTRILSLLDQTPGGSECTNTTINDGNCPEIDTDGHGTHIAGIAAGNGSGTGNGKPA